MSGIGPSVVRAGLGLLICTLTLWLADLLTAEPNRNAMMEAETPAASSVVDFDALPQPAPGGLDQAIVQRPLFHWTRRPLPPRAVAPVTEASAPPPPIPVFVMRGAMLLKGKRTAILQRDGGELYVRLAEGEELEGWKVLKVEATQAALEFQGRQVNLELMPAVKAP